MNTRVFVAGQRRDALPPDDRGVAYGDGLFETMRVWRGEVPWWDAHWARISLGAARLDMRLPHEHQVREQATDLLAEDGDQGDCVLKLLVTRGGGARGYAPPADAEPTWILSHHPLPASPPALGLQLRWCAIELAQQPLLAGLKHCNRLEQVLAAAECAQTGADAGLICDCDGNVIGATNANLFVLRDGRWATPLLDRCGVAGICRGVLIAALDAREIRLDRAAVETADVMFLCNAVRGILSVARINERRWPPHPEIEQARRLLAQVHPGFAQDMERS